MGPVRGTTVAVAKTAKTMMKTEALFIGIIINIHQ